MTAAYIYARVSGRGQVDGDGFPRQLEACSGHAEREGFTVLETFQELGVSGTKELENRPALQALYLALDSGAANVIIIEKLDRLARDLMVQETIISDLQKRGVQVISTMEPDLCSEDPSRKLVRQIFGAIAEYDRAMTVLKLRGARQRTKARNGRCEGRKPYGMLPGERPTLDLVLAYRGRGMICREIAARLNADGLRARAGGLWTTQVVAKILRRSTPDTTLRLDFAVDAANAANERDIKHAEHLYPPDHTHETATLPEVW